MTVGMIEGVQARGRRQPGDLRVADIQRNRDREKGHPGDRLTERVLSVEARQRLLHEDSSLRIP